MKISLLIILALFIAGCQSPKKDYDFVFYKWNIRESYYLKFNSSDTLYFVNNYPSEEQTFYRILNLEEKTKVEKILDSISFPKEGNFKSNVEDGEVFVFYLKRNLESKKLKFIVDQDQINFGNLENY